ncbi:Mut7-C RNAse domain-containing protein [Botryobacter ruber]|uniref:Mut7-C RNAse domain-containing protein n=1 Tax=Botryobacter ruber TaxID=2171629 RepID=UPI000E0B7D71|nr:Mut7-C RNAse domain-containing protein [Botryobacter ruber]
MTKTAAFLFHGALNDFLPAAKRNIRFDYTFNGSPAVKDAIEALGVPHPEVDVILINGAPAGFAQQLQAQDQVEVFPDASAFGLPEAHSIQALLPVSDKFVLDVHLGKLAKALRMLGFDTLYQNDYDDATIARLADQENRIVLTRDVNLLKNKRINRGYWLRSQHAEEQLQEVLTYFELLLQLNPFTRCLECNGPIVAVAKEEVLEQLPPNTRLYFHEFYQCRNCRRVYWKGSHYERMQQFIQRLHTGTGHRSSFYSSARIQMASITSKPILISELLPVTSLIAV